MLGCWCLAIVLVLVLPSFVMATTHCGQETDTTTLVTAPSDLHTTINTTSLLELLNDTHKISAISPLELHTSTNTTSPSEFLYGTNTVSPLEIVTGIYTTIPVLESLSHLPSFAATRRTSLFTTKDEQMPTVTSMQSIIIPALSRITSFLPTIQSILVKDRHTAATITATLPTSAKNTRALSLTPVHSFITGQAIVTPASSRNIAPPPAVKPSFVTEQHKSSTSTATPNYLATQNRSMKIHPSRTILPITPVLAAIEQETNTRITKNRPILPLSIVTAVYVVSSTPTMTRNVYANIATPISNTLDNSAIWLPSVTTVTAKITETMISARKTPTKSILPTIAIEPPTSINITARAKQEKARQDDTESSSSDLSNHRLSVMEAALFSFIDKNEDMIIPKAVVNESKSNSNVKHIINSTRHEILLSVPQLHTELSPLQNGYHNGTFLTDRKSMFIISGTQSRDSVKENAGEWRGTPEKTKVHISCKAIVYSFCGRSGLSAFREAFKIVEHLVEESQIRDVLLNSTDTNFNLTFVLRGDGDSLPERRVSINVSGLGTTLVAALRNMETKAVWGSGSERAVRGILTAIQTVLGEVQGYIVENELNKLVNDKWNITLNHTLETPTLTLKYDTSIPTSERPTISLDTSTSSILSTSVNLTTCEGSSMYNRSASPTDIPHTSYSTILTGKESVPVITKSKVPPRVFSSSVTLTLPSYSLITHSPQILTSSFMHMSTSITTEVKSPLTLISSQLVHVISGQIQSLDKLQPRKDTLTHFHTYLLDNLSPMPVIYPSQMLNNGSQEYSPLTRLQTSSHTTWPQSLPSPVLRQPTSTPYPPSPSPPVAPKYPYMPSPSSYLPMTFLIASPPLLTLSPNSSRTLYGSSSFLPHHLVNTPFPKAVASTFTTTESTGSITAVPVPAITTTATFTTPALTTISTPPAIATSAFRVSKYENQYSRISRHDYDEGITGRLYHQEQHRPPKLPPPVTRKVNYYSTTTVPTYSSDYYHQGTPTHKSLPYYSPPSSYYPVSMLRKPVYQNRNTLTGLTQWQISATVPRHAVYNPSSVTATPSYPNKSFQVQIPFSGSRLNKYAYKNHGNLSHKLNPLNQAIEYYKAPYLAALSENPASYPLSESHKLIYQQSSTTQKPMYYPVAQNPAHYPVVPPQNPARYPASALKKPGFSQFYQSYSLGSHSSSAGRPRVLDRVRDFLGVFGVMLGVKELAKGVVKLKNQEIEASPSIPSVSLSSTLVEHDSISTNPFDTHSLISGMSSSSNLFISTSSTFSTSTPQPPSSIFTSSTTLPVRFTLTQTHTFTLHVTSTVTIIQPGTSTVTDYVRTWPVTQHITRTKSQLVVLTSHCIAKQDCVTSVIAYGMSQPIIVNTRVMCQD